MRAVAAAAEVSVATVSRVLSGHGDLSESTRTAVLEAARSLGCSRPLTSSGRPRTTDSHLIEVVIGRFDTGWAERVVVGARDAATMLDYDLVLTAGRDDPADDWRKRVIGPRSSGLILELARPTSEQFRRLWNLAIPLVLLDPTSTGRQCSQHRFDRLRGRRGGEAPPCQGGGLRRFITVAGTPRFQFGRARGAGFRSAVEERAPGSSITVVDAQWGAREVIGPVTRAVADAQPRVGVFTLNDQMAVGVYAVAERLSLRIPEDLSIIGFDDDPPRSTCGRVSARFALSTGPSEPAPCGCCTPW